MASSKLKTSFSVLSKYSSFYTGGRVQVTSDGQYMLCQCGAIVNVVTCATGVVVRSIQHEDDIDLSSFILSPDDQMLIVATSSLVLRQWNWKEPAIVRTWKAVHVTPVASMAFDSTSTLLATGGTDATIKVWDVVRQYCTNNLRQHRGVVSLVRFHPDSTRLVLFAADDSYDIRAWSLESSTCLAVMHAHFSAITAFEFSPDGSELFSGGRDRVVTVWNTTDFSRKSTVAINETVESLIMLPTDRDNTSLNVRTEDVHFVVVSDSGSVQVWNKSRMLFSMSINCVNSALSSVRWATYIGALDTICIVTNDDNISLYHREGLVMYKQLVGHNDEVVDVRFWGQNDSHIAVATNSPLIKVFEVNTWACQMLSGHTDNVVSLDTFQKGHISLLASGSKDNAVRIWSFDQSSQDIHCIAAGYGHSHTVMAVALARLSTSFVVSAGMDMTIKLWSLPSLTSTPTERTTVPLQPLQTQKAHEKEIQALAVSPNDKLIASGSRDKKAKLWDATNLSLVGVLSGHTGGIWSVQFSPVDQCLATASADSTIKIWALSNFTCIRTFQGHSCSVLKLRFIVRGMQLLSCDSGGLVKLWNVKDSECVKTFEEYDNEAAVWALSVDTNESRIVTGSNTSTIILWKDVTEEEHKELREKQADLILKEQELSNLLAEKKYVKALALAITLDQPFRVLTIAKGVLDESGEEELKEAFAKLRDDQINSVVKFATKWITNGRHAYVTLFILQTIMQRYTPDELQALPDFNKSIESLLMYTERHYDRHRRMVERAVFVEYTLDCVKQNAPTSSS